MVQRKLLLDVQSIGTKPENRFSNMATSQELKKKKMKRTKPTRLKDTGKPPPAVLDREAEVKKTMTRTPSPQKLSVAKVTDGSPNYMKGTTSSEARNVRVGSGMEHLRGKKKTGTRLSGSGSGSGTEKQGKGLCRNSSLKMTKTPSFKRCSRIGRCTDVNLQRDTCSSTLKDSKFPEYLMLSPGATEAEGSSAFKVCPYTYCSLNGHLHAQYPSLKSFMSARRRALKSQRGTKMETSSPRKENPPSLAGEGIVSVEMQEMGCDGFVEIYVGKKEESERENGFCSEGDGQVSESLSDGAPRSEIDSEESFGFYHNAFATKTDPNESFVAENGEKEYPEKMESQSVSEIVDMKWEGDCFKNPGVGSDNVEMMNISEIYDIESEEDDTISDGLVIPVDHAANVDPRSDCCEFEAEDMLQNQAVFEHLENASDDDTTEKTADVNKDQDAENTSLGISIKFLLSEDPISESPVARDNSIQMETDTQIKDSLSLEAKDDDGDADKYESEKDGIKGHNHLSVQTEKQTQESDELDKQKAYVFGLAEDPQEIAKVEPNSTTEETFPSSNTEIIRGGKKEKSVFTRGRKPSNQDEHDDFNKWTIKCTRTVEEVEDSRTFNPREPNYLPIVPEPDAEKVDLKHQDIDERKNTDEWMIDYALQRAVSKLAPARKKKVALLVEAFETVIPVPKCQARRVKEPSKAFAYGTPLQACN